MSAGSLYLYSQSGSVRIERPFRRLHRQADYLTSHAISVVLQRVQGVDASNKDFSRSPSQAQTWSLTLVTECPRYAPCSLGFRRVLAHGPSPARLALVL